ncbi:MAG: dTMP kinase [Candidatus Marinarcus sp.]|uniref:dTMP kinase n=1 Tax=Candidatus Marinarcus sp. TaxID=3100987 RepID=UPI003B00E131
MYIVIEGIDTAGKSTQLDILKQNNPTAIFTKEPGGTKIGLELRRMVLNGEAKSNIAEMFLFLADRAEHIEEIIKPNINNMVISDRSMISGIAYASNLPLEIVTTLNLIATNNLLPTHVILLELSKEELISRLSQKEHDNIESRGIEYLLDIQKRMKHTIELLKINHLFIDASLSIEEIAKRIKDFINE